MEIETATCLAKVNNKIVKISLFLDRIMHSKVNQRRLHVASDQNLDTIFERKDEENSMRDSKDM
jgi:hypothetical protein